MCIRNENENNNSVSCAFILNRIIVRCGHFPAMCLEPSESLLVWLEELRTRCEDYEFGLHVVEMCDEYQNLWECSSTGVGAGSQKSLKYADECRVSVLFDEFAEEIRARRPVEVEDAGFNVPADVLDWTTKLLFEYCSEDDDFMVSRQLLHPWCSEIRKDPCPYTRRRSKSSEISRLRLTKRIIASTFSWKTCLFLHDHALFAVSRFEASASAHLKGTAHVCLCLASTCTQMFS